MEIESELSLKIKIKYSLLYCLRFQVFLDVHLIWQKPAHFLSTQMAVLTNLFQVFIVLVMYNFAQDEEFLI